MNTDPIVNIDGRRLYYMFLAGAKNIIKNQANLNKINVFPVRDGDTGTNMASTVSSVIESLQPQKNYKLMASEIAESTLLSARGNSGIIFAQFLYGMSCETNELREISLSHFIDTIRKSVNYVYKAVSDPVEGTMLTIIREWADFVKANESKFRDFNQLFLKSKTFLEQTLAQTKNQLEVLKQANVVDAGAKAFFLFIQGMIDFINSRNIRELFNSNIEASVFNDIVENIPEVVKFRYCTEGILRDSSIDHNDLSKRLSKYGDSMVIAGSQKATRFHIHTDNPANLFQEIQDFGTITFQKADDMLRQSQSVYNRKYRIALVTDSACDLSDELIDNYQIHMLPLNISFGKNSYLDKLTIKSEQFYNKLQFESEFPKTSQINEQSFKNLYSHLASHYDEIISVHLSEKFSGTYFSSLQAANKVSKEFNKKIAVIDSRNVSGGLGLLTLRIARAIEKGDSFENILSNIDEWREKSKIFVSVKTLKYMVKGGRVSALKGLIARIMNVKPIVSMDKDGKSEVFDKAFSQRANMQKVIKHIKKISKGGKIWNYVLLHANNQTGAEWYLKEMREITSKEPVATVNISPVVGANAGLGAASVAIMFE